MAEEPSGEETMLRWIWGYARQEGWSLIEDTKQPGTVIRGLVRNKTKVGGPAVPAGSGAGMMGRTRPSGVPVPTTSTRLQTGDSATATSFSKNCYEPNLRAG